MNRFRPNGTRPAELIGIRKNQLIEAKKSNRAKDQVFKYARAYVAATDRRAGGLCILHNAARTHYWLEVFGRGKAVKVHFPLALKRICELFEDLTCDDDRRRRMAAAYLGGPPALPFIKQCAKRGVITADMGVKMKELWQSKQRVAVKKEREQREEEEAAEG